MVRFHFMIWINKLDGPVPTALSFMKVTVQMVTLRIRSFHLKGFKLRPTFGTICESCWTSIASISSPETDWEVLEYNPRRLAKVKWERKHN